MRKFTQTYEAIDAASLMTADRVTALIDEVECGRLKWAVAEVPNVMHAGSVGVLVQAVFTVAGVEHRGRKWYISQYACNSEVVQTLFKAALTVAEHELRESFLYKGRAIYGPHFDLEKLHALSVRENLEVRNG